MKTNGVIGHGIRGAPHVERSDMIGGIFTNKALELGNVRGELGWHNRPTDIVADRIVDKLIEVGETEADHIRK